MISLHFPSLLVMRNESSFGEKEGECSTGDLPPPPNRRDERGDGRRAVHRLRNVRFISRKSELVPLLFFTSDGGEL